MESMLFDTRGDRPLIEAYQRAGRTLDDLPYTDAFEQIVAAARKAGDTRPHAQLFHHLHNLRKAGKLPRLGRTAAGRKPPRIDRAHEAALVQLVAARVGKLSRRDQLLYTEAFDAIVEQFNSRCGFQLDAYDVWRIVAKLAKAGGEYEPAPTDAAEPVQDVEPTAESEPTDREDNPWLSAHPNLPEGVVREAVFTLRYSRDRMLHAIDQLGDAELWWRPHPSANAAGNIVLHVCGNLRQWLVCGLTGKADDRDRAGEFAQRQPIPAEELASLLRDTVDQAIAAIEACDEAELLRPRFVQIATVTGLGAIFHSVCHLEGHAQEAIYIARLRRGEAYRFKDAY